MVREASAAGVPLGLLLAFVGIEAIASRTWAVVICSTAFISLLAFLIWRYWPREPHEDTIRRILTEHPDFACPMCGMTGEHKRRCPVRQDTWSMDERYDHD